MISSRFDREDSMTTNRERTRVLVVLGTRPEAIKMAPVVLALRRDPGFEPVIAVTAQHRELLDEVLELFSITPDYDLDLMEHGQSLTQVNCRVLAGIGAILDERAFDALLVHGDTTTTFAAALAGFYHEVPVGHVEAGMRSHSMQHPFPEEANRSLTARLTQWNFPPSRTCEQNLHDEGICSDRVFRTPHNTVIDALRVVAGMPYEFPPGRIADALASGRRLILVTAHRRESWGAPMEDMFSAIARVASEHGDTHFLVAAHPNPVVTRAAHHILGDVDRVDLIGPQAYLPFVKLMSRADLILSDSGGLQEEGPALGVPVMVLREVTEYPELVERGAVAVIGTSAPGIVRAVNEVLGDPDRYAAMRSACVDVGAEESTSVILEALRSG